MNLNGTMHFGRPLIKWHIYLYENQNSACIYNENNLHHLHSSLTVFIIHTSRLLVFIKADVVPDEMPVEMHRVI